MTTFVWWLGLIMLILGCTAIAINQINRKGATKYDHLLALILTLCGVAALVSSGNTGV